MCTHIHTHTHLYKHKRTHTHTAHILTILALVKRKGTDICRVATFMQHIYLFAHFMYVNVCMWVRHEYVRVWCVCASVCIRVCNHLWLYVITGSTFVCNRCGEGCKGSMKTSMCFPSSFTHNV